MDIYQIPSISNSDIFESLIQELFNSMYKTTSFKKFGRNGHNQKGIDLFSSESGIVVQCKKKDLTRNPVALKKELFDAIQEEPKKAIDNNLKIKFNKFIITSTINDHPEFDEYCEVISEENNFSFQIEFWGWDKITSHLINEQKILQRFYPNFIYKTPPKVLNLVNNLEMKKRMEKDFKNKKPDLIRYRYNDTEIMRFSRVIIRNIDDTSYPNCESDESRISNWFRVNIFGLYHNGIEIIVNSRSAVIFKDDTWSISNVDKFESDECIIKNLYILGRIPYSAIIDYDLAGDEFYDEPHIYCKYLFNGEPYEDFRYVVPGSVEKKEYSFELSTDNKIENFSKVNKIDIITISKGESSDLILKKCLKELELRR